MVASGSLPGDLVHGISVVRLGEALRTPVSVGLRKRVEALLARGRRSIALDLAGVTDLDAAGVGELVRVYTMAGAAKAGLWVENATPRAGNLLDLAGLFPFLSGPSRSAGKRARRPSSAADRAGVGLEAAPAAPAAAGCGPRR